MIKEIEKTIEAHTFILDDKKCATMKTTIEFIQTKMRGKLGMGSTGNAN